ncbi:MAG: phosphoribosylformylglycinamidine cyclo-ligase [Alphaproteobacteria bacterium]|nr:phosphoribosylformylglycinamidine cyclo-ligase [Alphaproteobacteria bacterium]
MSANDKTTTPLTYADAGVNIDAGDALIDDIGGDARRTQRPGADASLGGFGALFDIKAAGYRDPILVAATDGVGTKLELAQATHNHRGLGIDLVAMCANDVLAQGAMPLFFLDYFATGVLEGDVAKTVVAGIADGCIDAGCALIGGETAEMPGVYPKGSYDLAGFCVGAVERGQMIDPKRTKAGDVAIAVASRGVHANGFSLVRKVIERSGADLNAPSPFGGDDIAPDATLGEVLLTPTAIYAKPVQAVLDAIGGAEHLHGLAHITGGGLIENPPRAFAKTLGLELDLTSWVLPPVFAWLKQMGNIDSREMARVFNCGVGLLIYVDAANADAALAALEGAGHKAWVAGHLTERGDDPVVLGGIDSWEA